jgi:hypothetical protein
MQAFRIDSYKVRLELVRSGNPVVTHRNRIIEVTSVTEFHGIVERAMLFFSTDWDNWAGTPAVGYYNSVKNPYQPVLTCWLPSTEYSFWYDVLRSEKPLTFYYDITPIGGASYISTIAIGTSTEPLGEGPDDISQ